VRKVDRNPEAALSFGRCLVAEELGNHYCVVEVTAICGVVEALYSGTRGALAASMMTMPVLAE
jgi:hypothetical protein